MTRVAFVLLATIMTAGAVFALVNLEARYALEDRI